MHVNEEEDLIKKGEIPEDESTKAVQLDPDAVFVDVKPDIIPEHFVQAEFDEDTYDNSN